MNIIGAFTSDREASPDEPRRSVLDLVQIHKLPCINVFSLVAEQTSAGELNCLYPGDCSLPAMESRKIYGAEEEHGRRRYVTTLLKWKFKIPFCRGQLRSTLVLYLVEILQLP